MPDPDLIAKIRRTMAATFGIEESAIPDDASPLNLKQWDSLHNMSLIVALEAEFGIRFADEEVMTMLSLPELSEAIGRHLTG